MHTYGQLVHVEELDRNGIHYQIAVFRVQGGLHGQWRCSRCGQAPENGLHPTVEESVSAARKFLDEHHRNAHSKADRPPSPEVKCLAPAVKQTR
jgi:hypothetical protein